MDRLSVKLSDLIDLAYASATDKLHWGEFLTEVSHAFRDANVLLWHTNKIDSNFNLTDFYRYESTTIRAFEQHFYRINPWMQKKLVVPSGRLHRTEELYPENELLRTEFYNDFLRPNDLFKGFGISMYNDHRFAFLSIVRSQRAGPPSAEELRLLSLLTPHLQRAIQLHEHFSPRPLAFSLSSTVLDRLSKGVIFIGRDLRVQYMNAAAGRFCADADGFGLDRNRRISIWQQSAQEKLRAAVRSIAGAQLSSGSAILLARPSMRRPYALLVSPMPNAPIPSLSGQVAAVLVLADPHAEPKTPAQALTELFGLTSAEARIALKLSNGAKLREISEELGISYETTRNHLKSIFAKTDTHRQAEMVALCNRIEVT
jgi:DNA-binding CsgD family transcriptional regulator